MKLLHFQIRKKAQLIEALENVISSYLDLLTGLLLVINSNVLAVMPHNKYYFVLNSYNRKEGNHFLLEFSNIWNLESFLVLPIIKQIVNG